MKRCFIPATAMAALLFTGCMTPETHREDAPAAIVTVDRYQPNLFLVAMKIYEEDSGKVSAMPKVALESGLPAMVRLQESAAPALQTTFYPATIAPAIDSVMNGTQVALVVNNRPDSSQDMVELKLTVLQRNTRHDRVVLQTLTPPAIAVRLGQPLLILKRADGYITLALDPASPESLAQARLWSPAFPGLPAPVPTPIPPSAQ